MPGPWEKYGATPAAGPWTKYAAQDAPAKPDASGGFFSGLGESLNPLPALKAVFGHPMGPVAGGTELIRQMLESHVDQVKKGMDALDRGEHVEALGHFGGAALPVFGPAAAELGEHIGNDGFTGENIGRMVGLIGSVAGPAALRGVKSAPISPAMIATNASVADAVSFGLAHGIPVDAGTATGNLAIKAIQHLADRSLGGSLLNGGTHQVAGEALAATGRDLAADVHPSPVVPEQAGRGIQLAVQGSSDASGARATAAYQKLEQIQADPAHLKDVQVGMKQNPSMDPTQPNMIPDIQKISMPVDMRAVKDALRPVEQQISESMPPAQQAMNPALNAIRNILKRPDALPAAVADRDLGFLKGIQRGASGDQVKHFAGKAIDALDQQVQDAVTAAGPDAARALSEGRAATIDKYAARDVLDNLREEPVQAFNQALWKNDAGIDQLRAVQKFAPAEMPKLGRAFVDSLIDKATAEGDFSKQQGIWGQWQNLGPETKKIIFSDPAKIRDLDNFFLLAKKMGENPNPSGTAHVVSMAAQGGLVISHPLLGVPMELSGAALSKLMHNPAAVRALTEGMRVPIGNRAASAFVANKILGLAGAENEAIQR